MTSDFTQYLLAIIVIAICYLYFRYFRKSSQNLPPGPNGLPFIGVVPDFAGKSMYLVFTEWAKTYGEIVSFIMMGQRYVVINSLNLIRETFSKDAFSGRSYNFVTDYVAPGEGITFIDGKVWREQRRFCISVFHDFETGDMKAEKAIQEELKHLIAVVKEKNGKPFDIRPFVEQATCNVIIQILFGKRYSYGDSNLLRLMELINETFKLLGALKMTVSVFPWLRFLPGDQFGFWKWVEVNKSLHSFVQEEVDYHKNTYNPAITRDFIDAFLHRMEQEKDNPETTFKDPQLLRICVELFAGGLPTSSSALLWGLVYILNNPPLQPKLQTDIDRVIGSKVQPSIKHCVNLPNVEATINETYRYSSLAPLALPHSNEKEETIKGYTIPKDSTVIPNVYLVQHDPTNWKDPMVFLPERFINKDGHLTKPAALIPFCIGERKCLGDSLADMEFFILFSGLLQSFTFSPEEDGKPPSEVPVEASSLTPQKFLIRAKKRV